MGVGAICGGDLRVESRNLGSPSPRRELRVDCSNTFFPLRRTNFSVPSFLPSSLLHTLPFLLDMHASPLKIFCSERTNVRTNERTTDDAFAVGRGRVRRGALVFTHISRTTDEYDRGRKSRKRGKKEETEPKRAVSYCRSSERSPSQNPKSGNSANFLPILFIVWLSFHS